MDPKDLTRVESSLTRVLGPIARNLVAKAAARHHTIDELSRALALEIPDEADRAAFLKACGVTSGSHKTPSASQKASGVAKQIDEKKTFLAARKAARGVARSDRGDAGSPRGQEGSLGRRVAGCVGLGD